MARASGDAASPLNPGIKVAGPEGTGGGEMGVLSVSPTGTYYIYAFDGRLLAEYNGLGICVRDYIYMGGKLIAEYRPQENSYFYYATDQIGSTRIVTDDTGAVVYAAAHDPYGGIQKTWTSAYDPALKFSGKERDTESGLDYFGARYYDHSLYRFLSVDPVIPAGKAVFNPQRWNLYGYCGNNPITFVDPDGESYLIFCRQEQRLYVYTSNHQLFGSFPAHNNVTDTSTPFPNGMWPWSHYNPTDPNDEKRMESIGSHGIICFYFREDTNSIFGFGGYGVHAGGRNGFITLTNGCIRTTEDAMWWILFLEEWCGDPVTHMYVIDGYDSTITALSPEEKKKIEQQAERDMWSMMSYYSMWTDPFFVYGPLWAAR